MAFYKLAIVLAGAVAAFGAEFPQCFDSAVCKYTRTGADGRAYSFDLHTLCKSAGSEYSVTTDTGTGNFTYSFNLCGYNSVLAAPPPSWYPLYNSHGQIIMEMDPVPPCTDEKPCIDYDTGLPACCSGNALVLAQPFYELSLLDPTNPKAGGLQLQYASRPTNPLSPFQCPYNPMNQLQLLRTTTLNLYCDPAGSLTTVTNLNATETSTCQYLIEASTKAACAQA